ncbi:hypothetical protein CK203_105494 [Vitis vinifera]|uniref:Uncharacterized protein n=1 Tax=Vitis vinifera TaxID=29760 RepID=A0A438EHH8_VITVI|nr:hypothetical protein CK203_105494 [Vitis vinifera]
MFHRGFREKMVLSANCNKNTLVLSLPTKKPSLIPVSSALIINLLRTSALEFAVCLHSEWCEGQVTEYLVATFGDYFMDVKM